MLLICCSAITQYFGTLKISTFYSLQHTNRFFFFHFIFFGSVYIFNENLSRSLCSFRWFLNYFTSFSYFFFSLFNMFRNQVLLQTVRRCFCSCIYGFTATFVLCIACLFAQQLTLLSVILTWSLFSLEYFYIHCFVRLAYFSIRIRFVQVQSNSLS